MNAKFQRIARRDKKVFFSYQFKDIEENNRMGKTRDLLRETLFSWAPKSLQMVTAAMKLKECLLLGTKAMTNPDSILKSRDITLPTKFHLVKAIVFPVVMYG